MLALDPCAKDNVLPCYLPDGSTAHLVRNAVLVLGPCAKDIVLPCYPPDGSTAHSVRNAVQFIGGGRTITNPADIIYAPINEQ